MDRIIFENPVKQIPYSKTSSGRALLSKKRAVQNNVKYNQEQEPISQNQVCNNSCPNPTPASADYYDNQHLSSNNDTGNNHTSDNSSSIYTLFDLSGDDGYSTDEDV